MTSGLDRVAAMAELVEMRAGFRPFERVTAPPLSALAHRALTDFFLRRLSQKREQLGQSEQSTAAASTTPDQ